MGWISFPFLRYTFFLCLGILASDSAELDFHTFLLLPCFALFIGIKYLSKYNKSLNTVSGILLCIFFFLIGGLRNQEFDQRINNSHFIHKEDSILAYTASIRSIEKREKRGIQVLTEVSSIRVGKYWKSASGYILINILQDSSSIFYRVGNDIMVVGSPDRVRPTTNPGSFDYRGFLEKKNIYHIHSAREEYIYKYPESNKFTAQKFAAQLQGKALEIFQQNLSNTAALGIVEALILGYKKDLEQEVRDAWSGTGSMHVLAVSGLHVGIIFLFINLMFGWLKRYSAGRILFILIAVGLLFFYALLTGMSASVIRASIMFSLIIISNGIKKQSNIFNTLALSGFIMLLVDPYLLRTIGFQLSYLAVLGIVVLYDKIYSLIKIKYWFPDKLWSLTVVSIAAQLATFPLIIFYFQQYPVYGLLTNIIVIPSAFFLLVLSILSLATYSISAVYPYLFDFLEWVVSQLNEIISQIYHFPMALFSFNQWTVTQVLLVYGLVITLTLIYTYKHVVFVFLLFLLCLFTSVLFSLQKYQKKEVLIVYQSYKETHIAFSVGNQFTHYYSGDVGDHWIKSVSTDSKKHFQLNVKELYYPLSDTLDFLQIKDKIMLVVNHLPRLKQDSLKIMVDYLLIRGKACYTVDRVLRQMDFKQLIIDGSCGKTLGGALKNKDLGASILFHRISTQGAYVEEL